MRIEEYPPQNRFQCRAVPPSAAGCRRRRFRRGALRRRSLSKRRRVSRGEAQRRRLCILAWGGWTSGYKDTWRSWRPPSRPQASPVTPGYRLAPQHLPTQLDDCAVRGRLGSRQCRPLRRHARFPRSFGGRPLCGAAGRDTGLAPETRPSRRCGAAAFHFGRVSVWQGTGFAMRPLSAPRTPPPIARPVHPPD